MSEREFHKSPYSGTTVFAYYYDDLIKAIRRVELSSPVRNASTLMSQSRFRLGDQKFGDLREACLAQISQVLVSCPSSRVVLQC